MTTPFRHLAAALALLALAACGVDGEPERPAPRPDRAAAADAMPAGAVITGSVRLGVGGRL